MRAASLPLCAGAAGLVLLTGCAPSWPQEPARYRPAAVDGAGVSDTGAAAARFRELFGGAGDCPEVFAVDALSPEGATDLPAAVVAVCRTGTGAPEQAVRDVVVRKADVVALSSIAGEAVESVRSPLPGEGTDLEVRIWRPNEAIMVVVIGFGDAGAADRVSEAVIRTGRDEDSNSA